MALFIHEQQPPWIASISFASRDENTCPSTGIVRDSSIMNSGGQSKKLVVDHPLYVDDGEKELTELISPFKPGIIVGGKFALQRVIASGAMGIVFEAWDTFVERRVALKLMHPQLVQELGLVARFRREAQAAASISHPNVVTVFEVGKRRDGSFYIVQEFLSGRTLREQFENRGRLELADTLSIMIPIMGGLFAAHRRGIVHRDIKPENIILSQSPAGDIVPKLIDFGIAKVVSDRRGQKLTNKGDLMGTPDYMSPEQVRGQPNVDARTDIWAVGAVLYELLAGVGPFDAPTDGAILSRILSESPARLDTIVPEVMRPLADVIHRALEPDIETRFQSMQIFRDELLAAQVQDQRMLIGPISSSTPLQDIPNHVISPALEVVEELDPEQLLPFDESANDDLTTPYNRASLPSWEGEFGGASNRGHQTEVGWGAARRRMLTGEHKELAEKATHALSLNALEDAIRYAEMSLGVSGASDEERGRMFLVQAIAHRWLGNYAETSRRAREALILLPHASTGWYAALGHQIIALGHLGQNEPLFAITEQLRTRGQPADHYEAHIVTICRLVVFLVRAGQLDVAHEIANGAQRLASQHGISSPFVHAWLDVARAEFAVHEGDLTMYLRRVESAMGNFTSASDIRNACLQRANFGNAFMQLGAYERAAELFREAIAIAEPMQLDFVSSTYGNLGYALARLSRLEEALAMENAAIEGAVRLRSRRTEGIARIYMALILLLQDRVEAAAAMAQAAIGGTEGLPAVHAYAQAVLANILLIQNSPALALELAQRAAEALEQLAGIEEGESLIQVTYALALRWMNREPEGSRQILAAKKRLLEKAERISDQRWRQSFLENVLDNARLMHIATQWLGDSP